MGAQFHPHIGKYHKPGGGLKPVGDILENSLKGHAQNHGKAEKQAAAGGNASLIKAGQYQESQHDGRLGKQGL